MITLTLNPELGKDQRDANLSQLAMDYGLTPEQIVELALIMFGHSLRFTARTPRHTVSLVHWEPCGKPDCECGMLFPRIEASIALPVPKAPQGSSEGH